jgi:hypothetical protein
MSNIILLMKMEMHDPITKDSVVITFPPETYWRKCERKGARAMCSYHRNSALEQVTLYQLQQ